jgi:predicted nucleic acid-binding Zn ribbon protein
MTNEADNQPITNLHCWSCQAEIGPTDRFCRTCGAKVRPDASKPREAQKKKTSRRNATIMFLFVIVILLFAVVHRDPADIILVVAFGLPLCGLAAITWRMA